MTNDLTAIVDCAEASAIVFINKGTNFCKQLPEILPLSLPKHEVPPLDKINQEISQDRYPQIIQTPKVSNNKQ